LAENDDELFLLLPSSFCSPVPDQYIKVRDIIFPVFGGHVSLSEKYVMLDVFSVFIETFCRSMPQEHVEDWQESSLRLLPTHSCHFSNRCSFMHQSSNERANVHSTHCALI
jgi:hypothetical protein